MFALLLALLVLTGLMASSLFVAEERNHTFIEASGQVQRIVAQPGLQIKMPWPLEDVRTLEKRIVTSTGDNSSQPVVTSLQEPVLASWYVQWRVVDPQAYLQHVGDKTDAGKDRINDVVRAALKTEIAQQALRQWLVADGRKALEDKLLPQLRAAAQSGDKPWGIEIVALRINRIDVDQVEGEKLFSSMRQELSADATRLRADNAAELADVKTKQDEKRQQLLLEARQQAQQIRGEADAEASRIYAQDYAKDPQFANFYRSLSVYRKSFDSKDDVLVIDPANDALFQNLRQGGSSQVQEPPPVKKAE
ncbi:MAG: protease modulator HflC [Brachymonas sp.]|nr:protease modulator HflC [Brachymonas sp.]